ncbi:Aminoglycoside phosphotransferase, partial [Penicillium chermesinum]
MRMYCSDVASVQLQTVLPSSGGRNMVSNLKHRHDMTMSDVRLSDPQRLDAAISLLFPPSVRVQRSQDLFGCVHSLRLLTLSNGVRLLLKCSPLPGTPLLRRERLFLETEARSLVLLGQSANPCVPQIYHYDPRGGALGSAHLIRQYIKGRSLFELQDEITSQQKRDLDRHLGFLASSISQNVASAFGSLQQVAMGGGKRSWRDAFSALFESVLRDAEDMLIHIPYAEVRREMSRLSRVLDEVSLPRLVVVDFGRPSHVLINERTHQLTGIIDFSSAFWGDFLMAEIFEHPSASVLEGAGLPMTRSRGEHIRLLMYSCYRLISRITIQYYRNRNDSEEIEARRRLMVNIAELAASES